MFTKNTNMILCNPKSLRIKLNKNSQPQQNRHYCSFFFIYYLNSVINCIFWATWEYLWCSCIIVGLFSGCLSRHCLWISVKRTLASLQNLHFKNELQISGAMYTPPGLANREKFVGLISWMSSRMIRQFGSWTIFTFSKKSSSSSKIRLSSWFSSLRSNSA